MRCKDTQKQILELLALEPSGSLSSLPDRQLFTFPESLTTNEDKDSFLTNQVWLLARLHLVEARFQYDVGIGSSGFHLTSPVRIEPAGYDYLEGLA